MTLKDRTLAWHFLTADWRTGEGLIPVKIDEPIIHAGVLRPCHSGLHASVRAMDALYYAPSPVITLVECLAPFVEHSSNDKFVCTTRTALWGYDATEEIGLFARLCALDVIDNWREYLDGKPTGKVGREAVPGIVLKWLATGDEGIKSAARSAARSAASAADSAADSARSAARSADSAYSAAYSAARSARSAARSAARKPVIDAVIALFTAAIEIK